MTRTANMDGRGQRAAWLLMQTAGLAQEVLQEHPLPPVTLVVTVTVTVTVTWCCWESLEVEGVAVVLRPPPVSVVPGVVEGLGAGQPQVVVPGAPFLLQVGLAAGSAGVGCPVGSRVRPSVPTCLPHRAVAPSRTPGTGALTMSPSLSPTWQCTSKRCGCGCGCVCELEGEVYEQPWELGLAALVCHVHPCRVRRSSPGFWLQRPCGSPTTTHQGRSLFSALHHYPCLCLPRPLPPLPPPGVQGQEQGQEQGQVQGQVQGRVPHLSAGPPVQQLHPLPPGRPRAC
jgi:hypothetical protein